MGEKSNVNFLSDVLLPIFAFVSAASGPYGAAGAQALTGVLGAGERRRSGARLEERQERDLEQRQQDLEFRQQQARQKSEQERPVRQLEAAQSQFQLGNLQDVNQQLEASVPSGAATQALGGPQTERLQQALGRGEQVPLPQEAPGPRVRQQRFQQLATTAGGRAQLEAAGLGNVAQIGKAGDRQAAAALKASATARSQLADIKQKSLEDLRGYTPDIIPPEQNQALGQAIVAAQSPDELFGVVANLPAGTLKPKSARIEEYQFYANYERQEGREPLGPLEFDKARRKAAATRVSTVTNVGPSGIDYGTPPKDTSWARNADGSVLLESYGEAGQLAPVAIPVRGGAAYRDIQDATRKEDLSEIQARQAAGIVVDTINRTVGSIDNSPLPTTGLIGSALSNVPGTDAYDIRAQLDTVRSNVGFEALQRMRASSPTGGALGQVSDTENRLLQSVLGSVNQGQSKEELSQNLNRIREIYLDVLHGVNRPNRQLEYLTQEDIATLNKAQGAQTGVSPDLLTPNDLSNMTPEQLDALEQRLQQGSAR